MPEPGDSQRGRGWYYGWNIVAVLIVAQMAVSGLTYNSLSLFLKGWASDLHAPVSELTLAIVALVLVGAPVSPIAGSLSDRYPSRRIICVGVLWMAVFFVGVSFMTRAWQLVLLYALCAPGLTLCTATPANALIARWFCRRIGLALGLSAFGVGLGGVLLPPLLAHFLPLVGWRLIWRAAGLIVALIIAPLVLLSLRNAPTEQEGFHYLKDGQPPSLGHRDGLHTQSGGGVTWREVVGHRNFWLLVFIYVAVMGTGSALHQNIGPFAATRGIDTRTAAILISVMSFSHLVATLGLGILTDRFGSRRPLAGVALLVATGLGVLVVAHDLPWIVLGAALAGLNTGAITPVAAAIAAEFGPRDFGKAFGLLMFFVPLSSPFAYGLARTQEAMGSYTPALLMFIGCLLIAAALSMLLRQTDRPANADAGPALALSNNC